MDNGSFSSRPCRNSLIFDFDKMALYFYFSEKNMLKIYIFCLVRLPHHKNNNKIKNLKNSKNKSRKIEKYGWSSDHGVGTFVTE